MRSPDPKILKKITSFTTRLNDSEFVNTRKRYFDVAGGSLDVATYLSGSPECFSQIQYKRGKDIRIVFSPEVHLSSNHDAIYLRGAAILSLIDSLESQGNRVELWLGWDNTVSSQKYESRICAKRSTDLLNISSLAVVCCDTDFLRTCEFNMIGHFLQTNSVGVNCGITLQGDIVLNGAYDNMAHFDTVESTLAWIDSLKAKLAEGSSGLLK